MGKNPEIGAPLERLDLCLVVPAFDSIDFPPLGVSVVAAACRAHGLSVKTVFGSLQLAAQIGYPAYKAVCNAPMSAMLGEHLFRPHAYPPAQAERVGLSAKLAADQQALLQPLSHEIGPHQDALCRQIVDMAPRIVGITSTFQQNLAAAGLALRIKAAAPETLIVMGGANVAAPMGAGLAEVFPWIDYFFSGEADVAFPAFCERLLKDGGRPDERIVPCEPISDFAQVHAPDFSDYFAALRPLQAAGRLPAELPEFLTMESSRGCWWGQKHHCTFCGLNGEGMEFRQKPAERVLSEIHDLTDVWSAKRFFLADNIMPMNYFKSLLPQLAEWAEHPTLFYEVKANLNREQIRAMAEAGVDAIQPGIESLSTNVLKLMRKGVSARQNLALLRICRSMGVRVAWNHLYGAPGETLADYQSVLELIPKIEHLQPPSGLNRIIIDRYSPYFNTPEQFGIGALSPLPGYRGLYPAEAPLAQIAYHFNGDYSTPLMDEPTILAQLQLAIGVWKHQWRDSERLPALRVVNVAGRQLIADTRRIAKQNLTPLSREAYDALIHFEHPRTRASLGDELGEQARDLLDRNFLVEHEGLLMSVVTTPQMIAEPARLKVDAARRAAMA